MAGTIPQEIQRIEDEVATQAAKIAQLSTILDGKAGGGGGGAVETCTVTVIRTNNALPYFPGVTYSPEQNAYEDIEITNTGTYTIQCKKNTLIVLYDVVINKVSTNDSSAILAAAGENIVAYAICGDCTITVTY